MPTKTRTTPKPAAPIALDPQSPDPKPVPASRPLTDLQLLIADELADMLCHGSHPDNIDMFVSAAAHHHWFGWAKGVHRSDELEEIRLAMEKHAPRQFQEWKPELMVLWRQNRNAPPEKKVEGKTAADRIRGRILEELGDLFERFLWQSSPEERNVMRDMFLHRDMNGWPTDFDEIHFASELEFALERRATTFLRVPEHLQKQMAAHLELLLAADKAA